MAGVAVNVTIGDGSSLNGHAEEIFSILVRGFSLSRI
jgi:hypothetical protein